MTSALGKASAKSLPCHATVSSLTGQSWEPGWAVNTHRPDTRPGTDVEDAVGVVSYRSLVKFILQHDRKPVVRDVESFNMLVVIRSPERRIRLLPHMALPIGRPSHQYSVVLDD